LTFSQVFLEQKYHRIETAYRVAQITPLDDLDWVGRLHDVSVHLCNCASSALRVVPHMRKSVEHDYAKLAYHTSYMWYADQRPVTCFFALRRARRLM